MPRGRKPNGDKYWSDAHLRFLRHMAGRVLASVGNVVSKDELVAEGWWHSLRHLKGPNFHGAGTNVYKNMLEYVRAIRSGVSTRSRRNSIKVRQFPDDFDLDYVDSLADPHLSNDSLCNDELCTHVLNRLKPKESQLLRAIYIEGRSRMSIAAERGCSRWYISVQERQALAHARRIVNRRRERQTG